MVAGFVFDLWDTKSVFLFFLSRYVTLPTFAVEIPSFSFNASRRRRGMMRRVNEEDEWEKLGASVA